YAVHGADGTPVLEALTDWVYVDVESGRPRRVPRELETAFGFAAGTGREREAWSAPPAPPAPALGSHRVRACEVDSIGHVNNAVYLDLATQAALDAIEDAGWSLDRMLAAGSVPVLARADLEYLEGARYGDRLEITTWFGWAPAALDAHQWIARAGGARPLVRVSTRWRWVAAAGGAPLGRSSSSSRAPSPATGASTRWSTMRRSATSVPSPRAAARSGGPPSRPTSSARWSHAARRSATCCRAARATSST